METHTLSRPFKLQDGNEISEICMDFDALEGADYRQVDILERQISSRTDFSMSDVVNVKTLSFPFHVATAFVAALKGTRGLRIDDFSRIPMRDTAKMAEFARFFWLGVD